MVAISQKIEEPTEAMKAPKGHFSFEESEKVICAFAVSIYIFLNF